MSRENVLQQQPRQILAQLDLVFIRAVLVLQQELLTAAEIVLYGRGTVSPCFVSNIHILYTHTHVSTIFLHEEEKKQKNKEGK